MTTESKPQAVAECKHSPRRTMAGCYPGDDGREWMWIACLDCRKILGDRPISTTRPRREVSHA